MQYGDFYAKRRQAETLHPSPPDDRRKTVPDASSAPEGVIALTRTCCITVAFAGSTTRATDNEQNPE